MNTHLRLIAKSLALSFTALAIFTFSQGVARADEVNLAGLAGGCFGTPAAPCAPAVPSIGPSQTATLLGLHYNGSSFELTTANGFVGVGNAANPPNNFNNFGSFTLDNSQNSYTGNTFTVRIAFSAPPGTAPGSGLYTADLFGSVTNTNAGGVQITFLNPTQTFLFEGGAFTLTVNNLAITGGQGPVPLTGQIQAQTAPVPEPATLILLGTGLAGVASRLRKRKQSKQ